MVNENNYGPSKSDLKFRLLFSLCGLILLLGSIAYRGMPKGPSMYETIGITALFFGVTAVWTLLKLIKGDYSEDV